jgi:hypothetical protein
MGVVRTQAPRWSRPRAGRILRDVATGAAPAKAPNIHPSCLNTPGVSDDGFEELCHLVTDRDPDTALCGKDVTDYPWNPPWPLCEACMAVSRGEMN